MTVMNSSYPEPVSRLLTYGDCSRQREWPDYLKLGLTREHIPELIRMAMDEKLNYADPDAQEVWAPVHAWRALGQLQAEEAIRPLLRQFDDEENDWARDEIPEVYGMIGPPAIEPLAEYLSDRGQGMYARLAAAHALERIGTLHPEAREESVAALT